jgi:catechol 2,3-dioxygenase-like lactoylglutathione lyase family enzyme
LGALHYLSSFVELGVSDVDAAVRWYREVLGFQEIARYGATVHLRRGEGQELLLSPGSGARLHFATDLDLAGLAATARRAGSERAYAPAATAEDAETLTMRDPDGNVISVYARETG